MTDPAITQFPTAVKKEKVAVSDEKKIAVIAEKMREILDILGLDLEDASLSKTPERVAKMYVNEIFSGLHSKNFPTITLQKQPVTHKEMILIKNIPLRSTCEHHFVPMSGKAHVAYYPNQHIIGLSKVNRIVHYFGRRPQLQERLTAQIADSLSILLQTEDVAVYTSVAHHCVTSRGVEDRDTLTDIHVLRGNFLEPALRQEFFKQIL